VTGSEKRGQDGTCGESEGHRQREQTYHPPHRVVGEGYRIG
jgi:hypothetical protein